ncbi:MAG: DUF3179 domain-containing protein [Proteobacteria bacterium]|nr:MAG: DUF3179 domain-containing protein [Pseudomonadota bacterium]QKK11048.1 MAG: DUF3179 domain-containing protein [Pseudomonadota bacterium]
MRVLLFFRHRGVAVLRLGIVVVIGWWVIQFFATSAVAAPAFISAWPDTDFDRRSVALDEIVSGGPPKDGIPAIDRPLFVTPTEAAEWLDPREPVISVERNGDARAYPLQILIYHEIVNDSVGGDPLAVTFCPLCNASIVYERRVAGRVLDFGTTGLLRKSDLVMYDRQTESWWQQFTGTAIIGELNGAELRQAPSSIVAFEAFSSTYPQGRVLSRKTGHFRPYGRNPYRGYDRIGNIPFLLQDPADERLPAMERVIGVSNGDRHRVYPFETLRSAPVINDLLGDVPVVVFSKEGTLSVLDSGEIKESRTVPSATAYRRDLGNRLLTFEVRDDGIYDRETGSRWNLFGTAVDGRLRGAQLTPLPGGVHFAFAWLAFRPGSEIYAATR